MCNLSEGVWEKAKANQLMFDIGKLMSKGMKFDEVVNLLDIASDTAAEIRKRFNNKNV